MPMKFLTNLRAVWTMWWGATRSTSVDMVRKITHRCGSDLERFRIVLTHAGIRRIDEIKPLFITTGDNYH